MAGSGGGAGEGVGFSFCVCFAVSLGASDEIGLLRGVFSGLMGLRLDFGRVFLDFVFSGSPVCGRVSWKRLRVNCISAMCTPPLRGVSAAVNLNS